MGEITKLPLGGWIFYLSGKEKSLDRHKCGKWMYFFNNKEFAARICEKQLYKIFVQKQNTQMQGMGYVVFI